MKRYTKSGAQWTVVWKQKVGAPFNEPPEDYAANLAAQWGAPITAHDYEDDDPDPRTGELLDLTPPPTAPPVPPVAVVTAAEAAVLPPYPVGAVQTAVTILAKADADITAAEVKTLVLLMARFIVKKVLDGWR